MTIRTPRTRSYYPASKNEPDELLCWIPPQEYERVAHGAQFQDLQDNYPSGLEIPVTAAAFTAVGIDVGVPPDALRQVYRTLRQADRLPASGVVDGAGLEDAAQRIFPAGTGEMPTGDVRGAGILAEPEMTAGEEAAAALRRLK